MKQKFKFSYFFSFLILIIKVWHTDVFATKKKIILYQGVPFEKPSKGKRSKCPLCNQQITIAEVKCTNRGNRVYVNLAKIKKHLNFCQNRNRTGINDQALLEYEKIWTRDGIFWVCNKCAGVIPNTKPINCNEHSKYDFEEMRKNAREIPAPDPEFYQELLTPEDY